MSKKKADKNQEPDRQVRFIGGSAGVAKGVMKTGIDLGASGVVEIPLEDEPRKITWNGTDLELVALLDLLHAARYISAWDYAHTPSVMMHHFSRGGQSISNRSVSSEKSEEYSSKRRIELMSDIDGRLNNAIYDLEHPEK